MSHPRKPGQLLTAADVMRPTRLTVPYRMSLRTAARLVGHRRAHLVPVTDDQGRFIGVLSAADLLRRVIRHSPDPEDDPGVWTDWQLPVPTEGRSEEVRWHLLDDPVVARPDTRLDDLAGQMRAARSCRAFILDDRHRPVGVVTAADLIPPRVATAVRQDRRAVPLAALR